MMKAAGFARHGGPEVLQLMDFPVPEPGPGQVRVRVRAAGVQPYDLAVRAGWFPPGVSQDLPKIPGNEFAGVLDGTGAEVLGFGQLNAYAEYIVVPAGQVTPKPADMPWEVAGGFSASAQTAHIALEELAIGPGDTLLVHGAAGGVGTVAVQLAVHYGATVIGTGSAANQSYISELGAIPVVYGEGLAERLRDKGITAALDGAGGEALAVSLEIVPDRSRILTLVEHGRAQELGIRVTRHARSAARLAELVNLYTKGILRIHVRETFPLDRAADAHRALETGHGRGKVVIVVP